MYNNIYKYIFIDNNIETEINPPINWDDVKPTIGRNENYHGVLVSVSDYMSFINDGYDYLYNKFKSRGVNAKIRIKVLIKNNFDNEYKTYFTGKLNFYEHKRYNGVFDIKVDSDEKAIMLSSKKDAVVELSRTTDLYYNNIDELKLNDLYFAGRQILLTSKIFFNKDTSYPPTSGFRNNNDIFALTPELDVISKEDDNIHPCIDPLPYNPIEGNVGCMFYGKNDIQKTIKYNINLKHKIVLEEDNQFIKIRVAKYKYNGALYNFISEQVLDEFNTDEMDVHGSGYIKDINSQYNIETFIDIDEALSFQYVSNGRFSCWSASNFTILGDLKISEYICNIDIEEDSVREPSTVKCILLYEAFERINKIITKNKFKSNLLGRKDIGYINDGLFSETCISHGMYLRKMEGLIKFKNLSLSFDELYDSINSLTPIGLEINNEFTRVEDISYFYKNQIAVDLGYVTDFEITPDNKNYMSIINIGFENAGGYEDEQGLDEYNRETQYSTILETNNKLNLISKIRSDLYGAETIRRDIKDLNKDSKFDDHKWIFDINKIHGSEKYELSDWKKRFSKEPDNVYSPSTAYNLWFSPINSILRYGKYIKSYTKSYNESNISFNSSKGNSNLKTKLINGIEYSQRDYIKISDLERSLHSGQLCSFKAKISTDQIMSKTNGHLNFYMLFSIKVSDEETYNVFLSKVELSGEYNNVDAIIF